MTGHAPNCAVFSHLGGVCNCGFYTSPDIGEGIDPFDVALLAFSQQVMATGHRMPPTLSYAELRAAHQSQLDAAVQAAQERVALWLRNDAHGRVVRLSGGYAYLAPEDEETFRRYPTLGALITAELPQEKP